MDLKCSLFFVRSPENKFFGGCLGSTFFSGFGVYWWVTGVPPPMGGLLGSTL